MVCREQATGFRSRQGDFDAAGARLAFVSTGGPHFARGFVEEFQLQGIPVLSDERRAAYRLLDFKRSGASTLLSPRAYAHYLRAIARGFLQGRTQGDPFQQGGVVVVRPDGEVAYLYRSREGGDHPDIDEVLAALGRAAA